MIITSVTGLSLAFGGMVLFCIQVRCESLDFSRPTIFITTCTNLLQSEWIFKGGGVRRDMHIHVACKNGVHIKS